MNGDVYYNRNTIYFSGTIKIDNLSATLKIISLIVDDARYPDIIFDFKNVDTIYGSFLVSLLGVINYLKR